MEKTWKNINYAMVIGNMINLGVVTFLSYTYPITLAFQISTVLGWIMLCMGYVAARKLRQSSLTSSSFTLTGISVV
jgi:hypothetical protein